MSMFTSRLLVSTVPLALVFLVACGGGNDGAGGFTTGGQVSSTGGSAPTAGSSTGGGGVATGGNGGMPATTGGGGGATTGGAAAGSGGDATSGGAGGVATTGGTAGSGGVAGSGGSGATFPDPSTFVCNGMLGVSVNGDWFSAGFEDVVDNAKWQLRWRTQAFVEQWADPQNSIWSEPLVSACANGSTNPDRVLYTGVNWTYTTAAEWVTQLTAVVENIKTKYPAVKEIDLMTMLRAPGNKICGDPNGASTREQITAPFVDEALATVAAKYPTLVRVAPPFYAPSCDVFLPDSPHYAVGKAPAVSKVFSDYYVNH
jgi:hypothetical protein